MLPISQQTIYTPPDVIEYDFINNTLGAEEVAYESQNGYFS